MCGLAGYWASAPRAELTDELCRRMGQAIAPRGPDGWGVWRDPLAGLGFSHRRLAIQDVSDHGAQPMQRQGLTLVFNGEIYNHHDLRRTLEATDGSIRWQGRSDTETLLAGFATWGVEQTLSRAVGMFAFALWDSGPRTLTLGRDRFGEKPLYYGFQGGDLLFASDLAAIKPHPSFEGRVSAEVLPLFLRLHYVPTPYSIYSGLYKLPAGTCITFKTQDIAAGHSPEPKAYWSFIDSISTARSRPFKGDLNIAREQVEAALQIAIRRQMISDVPLGAFLSGGIDSATVVSLMQAQSSRKVRTFTIGSKDAAYDESGVARAVARHLGTDHTEMIVSPEDVIDLVHQMPQVYSEPFADLSQLPTYLVSQLARSQVTVALSGDAGDEVFGGYNRYLAGARLWGMTRKVPGPVRRVASRLMEGVPAGNWDSVFALLGPAIQSKLRSRTPGASIHKFAQAMRQDSDQEYYLALISRWKNPSEVLVAGGHRPLPLNLEVLWQQGEELGLSFIERMMMIDTATYMSDDVLVKVDRAAMAQGLETRIPFLDHELVELVWSLPLEMKVKDGTGKLILREILAHHVPPAMVNQPKSGFGIPVGPWLRDALRPWAEELLSKKALEEDGIFDAKAVRTLWKRHLSGQANAEALLWPILMFQAWHQARDMKN
jgi:asparagine synthase (glutamine-hydrolysing)